MIGGEHFLPCIEAEGNLADVIGGIWSNVEYRCTGRDAIHSAVSQVTTRRIWIPDYLCESIYRPIRDLGIPLEFYHVDGFDPNRGDWDVLGNEGDCVLLIHYFGEPQLHALETLRQRNIATISDVSHAMLNIPVLRQIGKSSDFSVCSLRKTAGVPDGGFVASTRFELAAAGRPPREQFWTLRAAALLSRGGSAAAKFASDENYHLFCRAERSLDGSAAGSHAMSDCSRYMLATFPWCDWSEKTALNHKQLRGLLGDDYAAASSETFSHLYPVLFDSKEQRDRVRGCLSRKGIIAPIHWDTSFLGNPHWISDRILSLPCDYRYSDSQIEHCASAFLEVL